MSPLRPRSIAGGEMSQRVGPSDERTQSGAGARAQHVHGSTIIRSPRSANMDCHGASAPPSFRRSTSHEPAHPHQGRSHIIQGLRGPDLFPASAPRPRIACRVSQSFCAANRGRDPRPMKDPGVEDAVALAGASNETAPDKSAPRSTPPCPVPPLPTLAGLRRLYAARLWLPVSTDTWTAARNPRVARRSRPLRQSHRNLMTKRACVKHARAVHRSRSRCICSADGQKTCVVTGLLDSRNLASPEDSPLPGHVFRNNPVLALRNSARFRYRRPGLPRGPPPSWPRFRRRARGEREQRSTSIL